MPIARRGTKARPVPPTPVEVIVNPDGSGDARTIAEAVTMLPPTGGEIALSRGTHVINGSISFSTLNVGASVIIRGQGGLFEGIVTGSGSRIQIVGAITAFTFPNFPYVIIRDVEIYGDASSLQSLIGSDCDLILERLRIHGVRRLCTTALIRFRMIDSAFTRSSAGAEAVLGGSMFIEMSRSILNIANIGARIVPAGSNYSLRAFDSQIYPYASETCSSLEAYGCTIFAQGGTLTLTLTGAIAIHKCSVTNVLFSLACTTSSIVQRMTASSFDGSGGLARLIDVVSTNTPTPYADNCYFNGAGAGTTEAIRLQSAAGVVVRKCKIGAGIPGGVTVREIGAGNYGDYDDIPGTGIVLAGANSRVWNQNILSVAASIPLSSIHRTILVDASGGARTITLPAAANYKNWIFTIKKIDASANLVIIASGGGTIDGAATQSITTQYKSLTVQSDGSNWWII